MFKIEKVVISLAKYKILLQINKEMNNRIRNMDKWYEMAIYKKEASI